MRIKQITLSAVLVMLLLTLAVIACDIAAPNKSLADITLQLSTYNNADRITGEIFLQNNSDNSQIHRNFILSNIVSFSRIEVGEHTLIMGSQKIVEKISVRKGKNVLVIQIDETEVSEKMEKARQTYLDTVIKMIPPGATPHDPMLATIDDVSFKPFMGIFNDCLVAVFFGGKYHGAHNENVIETHIGGFTFYWSNGYPILVWNEGIIYELADAYIEGILSREDLEKISRFYQDNPFWYLERD